MADVTLTTDQRVKYGFVIKDDQKRTVPIIGKPVATVNPVVASVTVTNDIAPNTFVVMVTALAPTTQDEKLVVNADLGGGRHYIQTRAFAITPDTPANRADVRFGSLSPYYPENKPLT